MKLRDNSTFGLAVETQQKAGLGAAQSSNWAPPAMMLLVSFISYLDRNTLAVLAPTILKETQLTNEQYGFIISAFSIAYMLGNPVWGFILDRIGLRRGMTASVFLWTIASTLHAFVNGLFGFAAARSVLGFGEGATFPGGLRTVSETLAPEKRSRGIAVSYSGGSLGAILTPLIVTPIALKFGWRAAFLFTGFTGLCWLCAWPFIARRISHTGINSFATMPKLWEARCWALICAYGLCAIPLGYCIYAAPIYLSKVLGLSQGTIGKLLWIPPLGWEIGYFTWGWIADRVTRNTVRPVGVMLTLALLSLPLGLVPFTRSITLTMVAFFFAMFIASGFVILALRYGMSVYSADHVALVAGIGAGSWSAIVALVMPVIGRMFDRGAYAQTFYLIIAIPLIGFVGWYIFSKSNA
ncbi:MAG TPA: MFS transporter [Terriglobales bacterium]|nr:MFS transporter [Terriglobales bacterium]